MGNCQVCGAPSGKYPLCLSCKDLKTQEKIRRCDDCGKWMEGKNSVCRECYSMSQRRTSSNEQVTSRQTEQVDRVDNEYKSTQDLEVEPEKEKISSSKTEGIFSRTKQGISGTLKKTAAVTGHVSGRIGEKITDMNKSLIEAVTSSEETNNPLENKYRETWVPKYRTNDGHKVRSKGERSIDNWFYSKQIVHEYEKEVTNSKGKWALPDFYLPYDKEGKFLGDLPGGIYVEFWGVEEKEDYTERMKEKQDFYKNEKFELVNIGPEDIIDPSTSLKKKFESYFGDKVR